MPGRRHDRILPPQEVEHLRGLIDRGEFIRAEEYASSRQSALNNLLAPALENRRQSRELIREVVRDAGRQEVPELVHEDHQADADGDLGVDQELDGIHGWELLVRARTGAQGSDIGLGLFAGPAIGGPLSGNGSG